MRTFAKVLEHSNRAHIARTLKTSRNRVNRWARAEGFPEVREIPMLSEILGIPVAELTSIIAESSTLGTPVQISGAA